MQKKELQTTRLVSLKLAKHASTAIDKRKGGKNLSLDSSKSETLGGYRFRLIT